MRTSDPPAARRAVRVTSSKANAPLAQAALANAAGAMHMASETESDRNDIDPPAPVQVRSIAPAPEASRKQSTRDAKGPAGDAETAPESPLPAETKGAAERAAAASSLDSEGGNPHFDLSLVTDAAEYDKFVK